MQLTIVTGRVASGKSRQIYGFISAVLTRGGKCFLLVPEQNTLSSERELLGSMPGCEGLMDAQVMSIPRFADYFFDLTARPAAPVIDARGKAMALSQVMREHAGELSVFRRSAVHSGFWESFCELLGDFRKFRVTPQALGGAALSMPGDSLAARKVRDVALIYDQFEQYLSAMNFIDSENLTGMLADSIQSSTLLSDTDIFIDGFDYLPPQTILLIRALTMRARSVCVSVPLDFKHTGDDLFASGRSNWQALNEIAAELKIKPGHVAVGFEPARAPALTFLEKNLFSDTGARFDGEPPITVCHAACADDEVMAAASHILELIKKQNLRWRNFAVLCPSLGDYAHVIRRVFGRFSIPVFLDERRPAHTNPAVTWLLSALSCASEGYTREHVMRMAKSGFGCLSPEEAEDFEDYVFDCAIDYGMFEKPFRRKQKKYDLAAMNALRRCITGRVALLPGREEQLTAQEFTLAVFEFLEKCGIEDALSDEQTRLEARGMLEAAAESAQGWNLIIETLGQLSGIVGGQKRRWRDYVGLLSDAFSAAMIGILPTASDMVTAGDIGRTKLSGITHLLILGAGEGRLPVAHPEGGILGDTELEALSIAGIQAGRSPELRRSESLYSLYQSLARPSGSLYISYVSLSEGARRPPSMIVDSILARFPALRDTTAFIDPAGSPEAALFTCARALGSIGDGRKAPPGWEGAMASLLHTKGYADKLDKMLDFASGRGLDITEDIAERRDGVMTVSASQLEKYANCPYSYLIEYGLRPQPDPGDDIDPAGEGVFLHEVMEELGRRIEDMHDPEPQALDALVAEVAEKLAQDFNDGVFYESARARFHKDQLIETARRGAAVFKRQLDFGSFRPSAQESGFYMDITLKSGSRVRITGKIDRVDQTEINGQKYLRAIDYKSGVRRIEKAGILAGSQLQLFIYMDALVHGIESAKPAGVFYFPVRDDYADEEASSEDAERMDGMMVDDANVLAAMDSKIPQSGSSDIIKVSLKGDGTPSARNKKLVSAAYMQAALDASRSTVSRLCEGIENGAVPVYPLKNNNWTACSYCGYAGVCRFGSNVFDYNIMPGEEAGDRYIASHMEAPDEMDT